MDSKEFLKRVFETGIAADEEVTKFMIKNYFLKGYTLNDFEEDLILNYGCSGRYAEDLKESFRETLKKYSN